MRRALATYCTELRRLRRTAKYVTQVRTIVGRLARHALVTRVTEWTPDRVRRALGAYVDRSAATQNRYRAMLHGFLQWAGFEGLLHGENPVERVRTVRELGPAIPRRPFEEQELSAILRTAPEHRAIVYITAFYTGLRRSELGKARPSDVDLDSRAIRIPAKNAKNRRAAIIPIPVTLLVWLRRWIARISYARRLFPRGVPTVRTLYADMQAAGVARVTADGRLDFHSLRYGYATALLRRGVPPQHASELMRHSDPRLTSRIYAHLDVSTDLRAAALTLDCRVSPHLLGTPRGTRTPNLLIWNRTTVGPPVMAGMGSAADVRARETDVAAWLAVLRGGIALLAATRAINDAVWWARCGRAR